MRTYVRIGTYVPDLESGARHFLLFVSLARALPWLRLQQRRPVPQIIRYYAFTADLWRAYDMLRYFSAARDAIIEIFCCVNRVSLA